MALARIITRSQACSRELALDLLARGYAVEIVSPDAIPDNLADLELQVDTAPGDRSIANAGAHDGEGSAALEFLHHLKAPMRDFIRRPPQPRAALHFSEVPVSFDAEPSIEDLQSPAEVPQLATRVVSPAAEILVDAKLDPKLEPKEGARPAVPLVTRDRAAGWRWRAALTFAIVLLLALVLAFGMRRTNKAAAPGVVLVEKVAAAPTDVDLLSAAGSEKGSGEDPRQLPAVTVSTAALKPEGNSLRAPQELPVANAGVATASAATASATTATNGASISHRRDDDLIAPDTVTYFDKRFDPTASKAEPANQFARGPSSRKHDGGVIAAHTVTYLDKKPTPKAAKRDSSINHHTDLR